MNKIYEYKWSKISGLLPMLTILFMAIMYYCILQINKFDSFLSNLLFGYFFVIALYLFIYSFRLFFSFLLNTPLKVIYTNEEVIGELLFNRQIKVKPNDIECIIKRNSFFEDCWFCHQIITKEGKSFYISDKLNNIKNFIIDISKTNNSILIDNGLIKDFGFNQIKKEYVFTYSLAKSIVVILFSFLFFLVIGIMFFELMMVSFPNIAILFFLVDLIFLIPITVEFIMKLFILPYKIKIINDSIFGYRLLNKNINIDLGSIRKINVFSKMFELIRIGSKNKQESILVNSKIQDFNILAKYLSKKCPDCSVDKEVFLNINNKSL